MKRFVFPVFLVLTLTITACAPAATATAVPTAQPTVVLDNNRALTASAENADLTRTDEQGAVVFTVTPLNLDVPGDPLEFDVAMNTHSLDLSMDLATLSTLSTDTGLTIQATKWDAIPGGHHVSGKLIFPVSFDGKPVLEGASKLTLTVVNVDAASRVFEWELK